MLEGNATGLLTLNFAEPTTRLSFGLGLEIPEALTPGALVDLYGSGGLLLDSITINTIGNVNLSISEGLFDYSSPLGFSTAIIAFDDQAGRFALDNLTFDCPAESIPEGGRSLMLLASAVLGLSVMRWHATAVARPHTTIPS